jgi:hypothetical protein
MGEGKVSKHNTPFCSKGQVYFKTGPDNVLTALKIFFCYSVEAKISRISGYTPVGPPYSSLS